MPHDYDLLLASLKAEHLHYDIDKIKPSVSTCNRLFNTIKNDLPQQKDNFRIVLEYIETDKLKKDRGFYQIVLQCLACLADIERQFQYLDEMIQNQIPPKLGTYIPIIESSFQQYQTTQDEKYFQRCYQILKENIIGHFTITPEIIVIFLKYWQIGQKSGMNPLYLNTVLEFLFDVMSKYLDVLPLEMKEEIIALPFSKTLTKAKDVEYPLQKYVLNQSKYDKLVADWSQGFKGNKSKGTALNHALKCFKFFHKKVFDLSKPVVIIDGANVGYFINRKRDKSKETFFHQINLAITTFKEKGWNVIVVLFETHYNDLPSPAIEAMVKKWRQPENRVLRFDVRHCNDDLIWMLAAFHFSSVIPNREVYIMSNDIMRNHHDELLDTVDFFRWRDLHQITYQINYVSAKQPPTLELFYPPPYGHYTQKISNGNQTKYLLPLSNEPIGKRNEQNDKVVLYSQRFEALKEEVDWCCFEFLG